MKRRTDYKTCPYCGCNLDVGERCDCKDAVAEKKLNRFILIQPENKGGKTA